MKILTFLNNVQRPDVINEGLYKAKALASTIKLALDFDVSTTTKQFTSEPLRPEDLQIGYAVKSQEIFDLAKSTGKSFDVSFLVFNANHISPMPTNPRCDGRNISMPEHWYGIHNSDVFAEFLLHELCHHFEQGNGGVDRTHDYHPDFSQKPRVDWYLHILKDYVPKKRWNYFTPEEKTGSQGTIADLKPDFVDRMDIAAEYTTQRCKEIEIVRIPYVINSGYRSLEYNKKIGGSPTSGHITRDAADVRARNWLEVRLIVEGAIKAGITGITVYTNSPHVHLDMKPLRLEVKIKQ